MAADEREGRHDRDDDAKAQQTSSQRSHANEMISPSRRVLLRPRDTQ
jgi:hypothetical protein